MRVAFIGLGNMGSGMAARQVAAGRDVYAFDLSEAAMAKAVSVGARGVGSVAEAVANADAVITMLPAGPHVRKVYLEEVFPNAPTSALLIDCSTIDVECARYVAREARSLGFNFADAPVSGGTAAAEAGTLAFMVGCDDAHFPSLENALAPLARVVIRAGEQGAGQAAKICNNMLLGISMAGTCEAFALAERLGLAPERFFEIASRSSGNCWSLSTYAPWPGVGPQSASDRNYKGGFAAAMMLKDMRLALQAISQTGIAAPLATSAEAVYEHFDGLGYGGRDFSGILQMIRGDYSMFE